MGNKIWSVLFGVVMAGCFIGFAISPFMGWWMPPPVSTHGPRVVFLFDVILYITAFFFVLTEALFVAFMWLYASKGDMTHPVSAKTEYPGFLKPLTNILHDQHRVEMAWTFVPAVILLYIAFAQVNTWADIKYESRKHAQTHVDQEGAAMQIGISARQFEWRMRYPSVERFKKWMDKDLMKDPKVKADFDSFGKVPQSDDVHAVNELHVWKGHSVSVALTTRDVIHSFNMPNFYVKQDALPGKMIPVWFTPTRANCKFSKEKDRWVDGINLEADKEDHDFVYDIPCAELCGWGHYRMIGRVFVHENRKDFESWLEKTEENYRRRTSDR